MMKILLVEDNPGDVRIIKELLNESSVHGYELTVAGTFHEACDFLGSDKLDIVLLDLGLPDSLGVKTLEKMHSRFPGIPMVVFTGQKDEQLGIETIQKGAQDYLVKGHVDSNLLSRAIKYSIERKNTEKERENLQEQLEQSRKMESIGRLAGGIAHDFNNVLGAISGYADMILRKFAKDNEKLAKYANTILMASQRAADLTANLLAFARKGKFKITLIDMHEVLNDINVLLSHTIEKTITVKLNLNASRTMVKGDGSHLQNAILNLVVNARDAMQNGGDLTITTETITLNQEGITSNSLNLKLGTYIKLSVKDTGIGIDEDIKTKIFEPFFTTKEMGKGTGLGLSSVYGCIKDHGGDITAESIKKAGSTFTIYLPIADNISTKSCVKPAEHGIVFGNGNILIVDDEEMIRDSTTEMLKELGYEVVCCTDGKKAVEYYSNNYKKVDAVILDLIMPKMDGLECLVKLKKINPDIAVIVSSGYSEEIKEKQVVEEGARVFLKKPYKISELSNALVKVFKKD